MKRKLVQFGIFAPRRCNGSLVSDHRMIEIYEALKRAGFVETKWQFIFDGQIGGLVYPYNEGLNEVHIRFYQDRLFAELEISRSSALHFVYPLFNANGYVLDLLKDKIGEEALSFLKSMTSSRLLDDELARPKWDWKAQNDPYERTSLFGSSIANRLGVACHPYIGWRGMLGCAILFAVPMSIQAWPLTLALSLLGILTWRFVPTVGRP